jgi:hypothetical protein
MSQKYDFNNGKYIVYFTTPGCSHCQDFNATWNAFSRKLTSHDSTVTPITLSTTDDYAITSDSPDVFAYPSVYAFTNGKYTEFNDDRTVASLMKFTQSQPRLVNQTGGGRQRRRIQNSPRRSLRRRRQRGGGSGLMSAPFSYTPTSLLRQPGAPPCAQHNGVPVDVRSSVPPAQQASGPHDAMPPPSYNAGLYTGLPFEGPWGNIPITPTAAGTTHDALRSANPPPGATQMYATGATNRPGNSYSAKPGVNHYDGGHGGKMHTIRCTGPKGGRRRRRRRRRSRRSTRRVALRHNSRSKRRGGLSLCAPNLDNGAPFHPQWGEQCGGIKTGGKRRRRTQSRKNRGGLNLRSLNMDDGAPFHPTWSAPGGTS